MDMDSDTSARIEGMGAMASSDFDPYHKWLGIPPQDQPPNHYRLLGVGLFEADGDVIEGAADQRAAHLRTFQSGPNGRLSQQLLNEVSKARIVLLDPQKRTGYDQQLKPTNSEPLADAGQDQTVSAVKGSPWILTAVLVGVSLVAMAVLGGVVMMAMQPSHKPNEEVVLSSDSTSGPALDTFEQVPPVAPLTPVHTRVEKEAADEEAADEEAADEEAADEEAADEEVADESPNAEQPDEYRNQPVGDDKILSLIEQADLTAIDLTGTFVTEAGVKQLRDARPKVTVKWNAFEKDREFAEWALKHETTLAIMAGSKKALLESEKQLPEWPFQVVEVSFTGTETHDEDLERMAPLQGVNRVVLRGRKLTDAALAHLAGYRQLTHLQMSDTNITGSGFVHLAGMDRLHSIQTGYGTPITDEGLQTLPELPNLRRVLFTTDKMQGPGLAEFQRFPKLANIRLHWGRPDLAALRNNTRLRWLWLDHLHLNDDALQHISQLTTLRQLKLHDNPKITDAGLMHLVGLTKLTLLDLSNTGVTQEGVNRMKETLPKCDIKFGQR